MIDLNLPEPSEKRCVYCGKIKGKMVGRLIHWPSESHVGVKEITIITGEKIEPFSFWSYSCQWCRGIETKRQKREDLNRVSQEVIRNWQ